RVRDAGFRIRLDVERVLKLREIRREVEVGDLALVEPVERQLLPIWRPPHRRALAQLLAVDPTRGSVFDASLVAAVRRDRNGVRARRVADPHVAILVDRAVVAGGRNGRGELAATLGLSPA